jgi:hypothetical protein
VEVSKEERDRGEERREGEGRREKGKREEKGRKRTVETLLIRHIVDQQNTHGTTVVSGSDGAEALLASGIPDLQLDALVVELDGADLEVNADGGDERGGEAVFAESQQTARFADARVAD